MKTTNWEIVDSQFRMRITDDFDNVLILAVVEVNYRNCTSLIKDEYCESLLASDTHIRGLKDAKTRAIELASVYLSLIKKYGKESHIEQEKRLYEKLIVINA
jgi:hypothetical protein